MRTKWNPGDARQIGINPLTTEDAIWYAGPDLAASVLLSGKVPQIEEAFAIVPKRGKKGRVLRSRGLRPVKLLDAIPIDPRRENFFTRVIEARQLAKKDKGLSDAERDRRDLGLKVIANASSYGIRERWTHPICRAARQLKSRSTVHSARSRPQRPNRNGPGIFFSADRRAHYGRRALHAGDAGAVRDGRRRGLRDGRHRLDGDCRHADGGPVPCPEERHAWRSEGYDGPNAYAASEAVQALSFDDVDKIAGRFESLNPTPAPQSMGSILKIEGINFEVANPVSFGVTRSPQTICAVDAHEHSGRTSLEQQRRGALLGARPEPLANPTNIDSDDRQWIVQSWETIAREHLGLPTEKPSWLARQRSRNSRSRRPTFGRPFETDEIACRTASASSHLILLAAHIRQAASRSAPKVAISARRRIPTGPAALA